ncbi:aquaporin-like protein [Ceraceosorus guamensis]|uniref:Aquaporin-like protein n=1 Tax=Ceraceosorus guamensis TaxID=1522189 RepID=A0A316VNK0_9BASI|nr:aquaporin-like protein [Ceraceosorus guamensis]PWN39209.1 aquaporin-like protein [Ceraceosorus guamensis]
MSRLAHQSSNLSRKGLRRQPTSLSRTASSAALGSADPIEQLEASLPKVMRVNTEVEKAPVIDEDGYLNMLEKRLSIKNIGVIIVSELLGTILFLFFAFFAATQASNRGNAMKEEFPTAPLDTSGLLFSSLGFGFSLAVNAWLFFRISGGLFNPAVTLALTLTGTLSAFRCAILTITQFVGGILAALLVTALVPGPINSRTTLGSGVTVAQGFWIEFFCTAELVFAIFMLAGEKHKGTFLAPVGIGLALFIAEIAATNYTGGSLNPARSLGPDVVTRTFEGSCWIYYIAPYLAAIVTSGFYWALKWMRYETANPDQDAAQEEERKSFIRDMNGNIIGELDSVPLKDWASLQDVVIDAALPQDDPHGAQHVVPGISHKASEADTLGVTTDSNGFVPGSKQDIPPVPPVPTDSRRLYQQDRTNDWAGPVAQ